VNDQADTSIRRTIQRTHDDNTAEREAQVDRIVERVARLETHGRGSKHMALTERMIDGVAILDLSGHLTEIAGNELLARVKQLTATGSTGVLLNLARVSYIDSAGLGAMVASVQALRRVAGAFKLLHPTLRTRHLLEVTALTTIMESFDVEDTAVASFCEATRPATIHQGCNGTPCEPR
jgi:anti-sigma B factor antagonist